MTLLMPGFCAMLVLLPAIASSQFKIIPRSIGGPNVLFDAAFLLSLEKAKVYVGESTLKTQDLLSDPAFHLIYLNTINRLERSFDDRDHAVFLCYQQAQLVGYVDLDRRVGLPEAPDSRFPRPYLSELCTHPFYRQQGLGQALVERCILHSKNEWKESSLFLCVETTNLAAIRLYRRLQFVPVWGETGPVQDPRLLEFKRVQNWDDNTVDRILAKLDIL